MDAIEFGKYLRSLREAQDMSIRQLAMYSKVSNSYISQIENGKRGIPNPEILEKLAPYLKVSYNDLMIAAGYIKPKESNKYEATTDDTPKLTRRDEIEIEKAIQEFTEQLENAEGLMFDGDPASPEAIQSIIDSMRVGMEIAKKRNKEKYTPKKYKKDKKSD